MKKIGELDLRSLYQVEKRVPSGETHIIYEGRELMKTADGTLLENPNKPKWWNRQDAEKWLRGEV
ncbi:hypothetical protein [Sinorhizobium meliloti]|nr:hypothetical protein U8C45_22680 [Sinorhizobium meliloti]